MANIVVVDMESYEPDSTVEIVEIEEVVESRDETPLQAMNHQLVERQHLCANMVAASMRDRERVRSQLEEARKQRESIMADFRLVVSLCKTATLSCTEAKASLEEAKNKRLALLKEIDAEKMWRPPSAEMSLKKQQELRERVEHMRTILGIGKICTPDDCLK